MNKFFRTIRKTVKRLALSAAIGLGLMVATPAKAQFTYTNTPMVIVNPNIQGSGDLYLTNQVMANSSNLFINASKVIQLRAGQGLALFPRFASYAGAIGSNALVNVYVADANTNWTTLPWCSLTLVNNDVTNVVFGTNFTAAQLANYQFLCVGTWRSINATNGFTNANCGWSITDPQR